MIACIGRPPGATLCYHADAAHPQYLLLLSLLEFHSGEARPCVVRKLAAKAQHTLPDPFANATGFFVARDSLTGKHRKANSHERIPTTYQSRRTAGDT